MTTARASTTSAPLATPHVALPNFLDLSVKLFSKDESFFDHFRQLATHIASAADLLREQLINPADALRFAEAIKKVETDGDAVVQTVNQRIDTSFVTPLDREDIHLLAHRLDNVIDLINGAARRVVMFRVTDSRPGAVAMAELLVKASREIQTAVDDVTKLKKMQAHSAVVRKLEQDADTLYGECIGGLFTNDEPAIEVIKWKEIYDALEHAIDESQDVANVLESIALKNS